MCIRDSFVPFLIPLHPYYTWRTATDTAQGTITAIDEGANGEIIIYVDWAVFSFSGVKSKYIIYPDGKIEVNHEGTPVSYTHLIVAALFEHFLKHGKAYLLVNADILKLSLCEMCIRDRFSLQSPESHRGES